MIALPHEDIKGCLPKAEISCIARRVCPKKLRSGLKYPLFFRF